MMRNITVLFFAALAFLLLSASNSWAFRCGTGLVGSGDSKTRVLVTCGKPTSKESSCENRQEYTSVDKAGKVKKFRKCGKKLEVWHYNCGDNDFIYTISFENGLLKSENTEGRGRGKSDCLGK
jgi:hypothetical protein